MEATWGIIVKTTAATAFIPLSWSHFIHSYEFILNLCLMTPEFVSPLVTSITLHILQKPQMYHVQIWFSPQRLALPPVYFFFFIFSLDGTIIPPTRNNLDIWESSFTLSLSHHQHTNDHWVVPILLSLKNKLIYLIFLIISPYVDLYKFVVIKRNIGKALKKLIMEQNTSQNHIHIYGNLTQEYGSLTRSKVAFHINE